MKLFQVHAGFYDPNDVSKGFYEGHTNFFVCAKDISSARKAVKEKKKNLKNTKCILMVCKKSAMLMVSK